MNWVSFIKLVLVFRSTSNFPMMWFRGQIIPPKFNLFELKNYKLSGFSSTVWVKRVKKQDINKTNWLSINSRTFYSFWNNKIHEMVFGLRQLYGIKNYLNWTELYLVKPIKSIRKSNSILNHNQRVPEHQV